MARKLTSKVAKWHVLRVPRSRIHHSVNQAVCLSLPKSSGRLSAWARPEIICSALHRHLRHRIHSLLLPRRPHRATPDTLRTPGEAPWLLPLPPRGLIPDGAAADRWHLFVSSCVQSESIEEAGISAHQVAMMTTLETATSLVLVSMLNRCMHRFWDKSF